MSTLNKVLFVIGSLQVGGAERQLTMLAVALAKRGVKVRVFCLESGGPLAHELESMGVEVHIAGYNSAAPFWRKILQLAIAQACLTWQAAAWSPQVLHSFLPLTNFMGVLAGRLGGVRCIITSRRALGTHQDRHPWWKRIDRLTNRLSTVVTANSQAVIEDTVARDRMDGSKMALIYNGIEFSRDVLVKAGRAELRRSLGLMDHHIALVFVANLIPYKGHLELIEAFARVHRKCPNTRLFLIGEDRGIGAALTALAAQLSIEDFIVKLGRRDDVIRLLAAMDIGVMASHEEGFSNALLEKLAAGLPVVATAVGGNPEALADMPGCVIVPPRNIEELAVGIENLVTYFKAASAVAEFRTRTVTERYSLEAMVRAHERLYRQAMGLRG